MESLESEAEKLRRYYLELMSYTTSTVDKLRLAFQLRVELGMLYLSRGVDPPP